MEAMERSRSLSRGKDDAIEKAANTMPDESFSPDYTDKFEVAIPKADTCTAEQWFRAIFEDAPLPVRWFLLLGWRAVLGLRLGPLLSPDYILGWRIASKEPETVRLELHSALMKAQLTLHLSNSMAVWNTSVFYTRPMARPLWASVGVIHRLIVPYLLKLTTARVTRKPK